MPGNFFNNNDFNCVNKSKDGYLNHCLALQSSVSIVQYIVFENNTILAAIK